MRGNRIVFDLLIYVSFCAALNAQDLRVKFHHRIELANLYENPVSSMRALSISIEKKVYLVDGGLNRVLYCDSTGALLKEVGGFGWESEQFDRPVDIWAKNSLDVFVADYNNSRIQRFDRNLNFITAIIGEEIEPETNKIAFPVAIAWANFGDLFIIEQELNRIIQFDENGNVTLTFGDFDEGEGQLVEPVALCINDGNEIFVADKQRKAILKFDYYGNILQTIVIQSLLNPKSLCLINDHLVLLDGQKNLLYFLSKNGENRFEFSQLPDERNKPDQITDICSGRDRLYILNDASKRIEVYGVTVRK